MAQVAILFLLPATFIAFVLLLAGLRGRRIGDHPICRRCGYDLFGQPAGTAVCGECGSDLNRRRALLVGHHQRRKGLLLSGVVLLVPFLPIDGILIWGRANHVDWLKYAPTWWLISRAQSADPAKRSAALAELIDRAGKKSLTGEQWVAVANAAIAYDADSNKTWDAGWESLVEPGRAGSLLPDGLWKKYLDTLAQQSCSNDRNRQALALTDLSAAVSSGAPTASDLAYVISSGLNDQADPTNSWTPAWGDLIEKIRSNGLLSDERWKQYASQVLQNAYTLHLRPKVRLGDPVCYSLEFAGIRTGTGQTLMLQVHDERLEWDNPRGESASFTWPADQRYWVLHSVENWRDGSVPESLFPSWVSSGPQRIRDSLRVQIAEHERQGKMDALAESQVEAAGTFILVPANQPTVELVHKPALADVMRQSITVEALRLSGNHYSLSMHIRPNMPAAMVCDVLLRQRGKEIHINSILARTNPFGSMDYDSFGVWPDGKTGKSDIILRPNPSVAADTLDITQIWGGEIVIKDVPVQYR